MSERSYTVREIEELRRAVETKWLFGSYRVGGNGGISRSYDPREKTIAVEEMVRTHMLAGHTATNLYLSEGPPPAAPAQTAEDFYANPINQRGKA